MNNPFWWMQLLDDAELLAAWRREYWGQRDPFMTAAYQHELTRRNISVWP